MATTPVWVPLVVAYVGAFVAIGSAILTHHFANRREDARWRREREREQSTWAREDAARSYEHRRDAYVDFIKEFNQRWNTFIVATDEMLLGGRADNEPPSDYLDALYDRLVQIQIFGTKEAAKLAEDAFNTLSGVFHGKKIPHDVLVPLQSEIRRDLSIPDRPA